MLVCIGGICAVLFVEFSDFFKSGPPQVNCPRVDAASLELIKGNLESTSLLNPLDVDLGRVYQIEANSKELHHLSVANGTIILKNLEFRGITPKKVADYRRDTGFKLNKGICGLNGTYSFQSIKSP